jgi:hypothetical protein
MFWPVAARHTIVYINIYDALSDDRRLSVEKQRIRDRRIFLVQNLCEVQLQQLLLDRCISSAVMD